MGFFKAYDMRGTFGVDFDLDTVRRVGRALPQVVGGPRWLVGRDGRETSPAVRDALVRGLAEAGAEVADMGLCTTPMVYHATAEGGYDGSVMVTASHNPPGDNGLKVSRRGAVPVGYAQGLDKVEALVGTRDEGLGMKGGGAAVCVAAPETPDPSPQTLAPSPQSLAPYLAWQREATPPEAYAGLRYAVDCSNGTVALLARAMFPGADILNDTVDGRFPAHAPNPLRAEAREQVAARVREKGLDCGIVFDGDGDRAVFVDETGAFVSPDLLIPTVAAETRERQAQKGLREERPKVLHDVRTSRAVVAALREMGAEPVMVPVGHVFAKQAMRETGALCGGELAGHYYFREFHGCDSGVLAATRILSAVARAKAAGRTFSQLVAPLAGRYANSGELNFRVVDKTAAVGRVFEAAARFPNPRGRSRLDGIRMEFAEGWFSLRASNTEPYLRLVVECDGAARLADWVRILTEAMAHEG